MSRHDETKVDECENCAFPSTLKRYPASVAQVRRGDAEDNWFCDLCASTFFSRYAQFGGEEYGPLYPSIAYMGNAILAEISALRAEVRALSERGNR
jgi:hypothetical protein